MKDIVCICLGLSFLAMALGYIELCARLRGQP